MAPVAILLFALMMAVYTNQLYNVYIPEYESEGKLWEVMFTTIHASFVVFQATMLGIFALSQAIGESIVMVPLIFGTILIGRYTEDNLGGRTTEISLSVAADLDKKTGDYVDANVDHLYEHPAMLAEPTLVPDIEGYNADAVL